MRKEWDKRKQDLGLTQATAAKAMGITQSTFARYLNGFARPNTEFIIKLSRVLRIQPHVIDGTLRHIAVTQFIDAKPLQATHTWEGVQLLTPVPVPMTWTSSEVAAYVAGRDYPECNVAKGDIIVVPVDAPTKGPLQSLRAIIKQG